MTHRFNLVSSVALLVFATQFMLYSPLCLAMSPLSNAFALWNFKTSDDSALGENSLLPEPSAQLGVPLSTAERSESLAHDGDGYVAQTSGAPLLAGRSTDSLVVPGDQITVLIRVKDPTGQWGGELLKRREPVLSYNVYTYDFGAGPQNMTLGFEIGTTNQSFNSCRFLMSRLPSQKGWQDIIARYDGRKMELIVNGVIMASSPASGDLLPGVDDQFEIANKFKGQFDTVAIWKRALTDTEVSEVSDTKSVIESPYLDTTTNRGPFYDSYQKLIDTYSKAPNSYEERFRPQFHWTPTSGWMNDPNGLVYFNGLWRQFAQHRLPGEEGMRWGYATSKDLVHWTQHPEAILPDSLGDIWSGSAVVDQYDTSGFFHGKPGLVCIFTYHQNSDGGRQCQGIAYSSDGVTFSKYIGNPVVPELRYLAGQEDDVDFRDPKVFWYQPTQRWIMITAGGYVRIWSSPDLKHWTNESVEKDIQTECPDLFPMHLDGNSTAPETWVLSKGGVEYLLGSFDGHRFSPNGPAHRFNYGHDFYASQTYSNVPDGRRIMSTWVYQWGDGDPAGIATTGGLMSAPTVLTLVSTADGPRIAMNPAAELNTLRGTPFTATDVDISPLKPIVDESYGNQCEIIADFDLQTASRAGLSLLGNGAGNETLVGYDVAKQEVFIDRSHSGLSGITKSGDYLSAPLKPDNGHVRMHILVDHAVVELFAGDGLAPITARCFPPDNATAISAFADGGAAKLSTLEVYPLKSIWHP